MSRGIVSFVVLCLLTGCTATLPIVGAASYVTGQTICAYLPDPIEQRK